MGKAKLLAESRKESVPRQESRGRGEGSEPKQTLQAELTPALQVLIVLHTKKSFRSHSFERSWFKKVK